MLLKPLPYPDPDQLVTLWERSPERGIDRERVSGPNYLDWREQSTVCSEMAVSPGWDGGQSFNIVLRDTTAKVSGSYTSASLFATLGTQPLLGRTLLPEEDRKEGNRAAVLGYGLWQRHFGGDSNVIGQTLTVDTYGRRQYTIVGVMPTGFGLPGRTELWLPLGWMDVSLTERRQAHWHNVIARLKPGVTLAQAQSIIPNLPPPLIRTMDDLISDTVAQPRFQAGLLSLLAALALLLAAVGLYGVLAYTVTQRRREIGVRMALGAQERNILSLVILQGMRLAMAGVGIGVLSTVATTRVLRSMRYDVAPTDTLTLCAVTLLLVAVALIACWLPARHAAKIEPMEALRHE